MLRAVKNVSCIFAALVVFAFLRPLPTAAGENAESRAWQINVPSFELREATIEEGIRALAAKSRALDPRHEGVNFVWPSGMSTEMRLNLRLANLPLHEAARYVARLAGMRLTTELHALVFTVDDGQSAPEAYRYSPAARMAEELIVPRVEFRDATLPAAIAYLERLGRATDPRKAGVNIVVDVPPETRETRITLSLAKVPLGEAVRYAAGQANMIVLEEPYALVVTVPERQQTRPESPEQVEQAAVSPPLFQGWKNPLLKPAEAVAPGSTFRDTNGDIQPEKSGHVPRRSMGGWPQALDPGNGAPTNSRMR